MNNKYFLSLIAKKGLGLRILALFCLCLSTIIQAGPLSENLLLVAQVNGKNKLYICRSDGKDLRKLSSIPGEQNQPCYSPSLQRIFFVKKEKKNQQIFSVDLKGKDLKQHTFGLFNSHHPDVCPDGTKIAFASTQWGAEEIAELDLLNGEIKRLTYDKSLNLYPKYSPDGKQLLYLSRRQGAPHLYLMDLSRHESHRLTHTVFSEGPGSWHPQGERIIATNQRPPGLRNTLIEIDLKSKKNEQIAPKLQSVHLPKYSADGSKITYISNKKLYLYDLLEASSTLFPLKGQLALENSLWITVPLP